MMNVQQSGAVRWVWDADGVVVITLDDPGRTSNAVNRRHLAGLDACLDELEAHRADLRGAVVTSGKHSFFSGPDMVAAEVPADEAAELYGLMVPFKDQLRRLEKLGRPVAAALTGSALGGGVEIALACHHRVGVDDPDVVWSLGETAMGVLPGGGGTVRVTRMLGVAATVLDVIGPGSVYRPEAALRAGLVDDLAPTRDAAVAAAREWVLAQRAPFGQRWEQPGYRVPGRPADLAEQVRGRVEGTPLLTYPAVLDVATRSLDMTVDEAFPIETDAFNRLAAAPVTAGMSHNYFSLKAVAEGRSRPAGAAQTAAAAQTTGTTGANVDGTVSAVHPRTGELRLADAFFAEGAPVIEIHAGPDASDAAIAAAYDRARAGGGIPIVSRGGDGPFVDALLRAGDELDAIVSAARQALASGLSIAPADADVASMLAVGLPIWTGGISRLL
ncbi:enoyl-CoA hydratase-related protein [Actinoplanes sp. NPDC049265]|uniref:enoyl-CoA hydratase-related protein n=1 Tax=Actinoplanes sp. NPDC049265 TaxID=3363902 RepID=UPI003721A9E2